MTDLPSSPPRRGARTFRAACVVLASVAAAQAAATAWSSKTTEQAAAKKLIEPLPEEIKSPPPAPVDPFSPGFVPADDPHPELKQPAGEPPPNDPALALLKPEPVVTMPRVPAPRPPAPLDTPITQESVLADLDEALTLRSRGDMQGALTHFRVALKELPDHPKLLYHTAQTLDTMGLTQKADPYWKALYKLGAAAGDYFVLAQERMAEGPQVLSEPEEEKEGKFTIADLRDEKVSANMLGERIRFTAVIKKQTGEPVDTAKEMSLIIHFFDSVNGRRIARSQVTQPVLACTTQAENEPLDWDGNTETFTWEYYQPDMAPEQLKQFGRCRYYGCTFEVYFKDKLQDITATTPELLQLARELPLPPPEPEESILESTPGPQPEASLFPPSLKP